jgi:acetyl esterase/lipase
MPSLQSRITKAFIRFSNIFILWGRAPVRHLRFELDFMASLAPPAKGVRREACLAAGMKAEWLLPEGCKQDKAILYLHGGGYIEGSVKSHRDLAGRLARAAGCKALLIDYRLAPESQFPAAVDDAVSAYRWLLSQGFRPERLVIAGDSAGGGLTAAALISLRDSGDPLPAGAILISPWADLGLSGDSMDAVGRKDPMLNRHLLAKGSRLYRGEADTRNHLVSPIYADLAGLPPLCIHVGTCERLLDDSRRLAERARQVGVPVQLEIWDGMFHVWHSMPLMPESRAAVQRLGEFFNRVTAE